MVVHIRGIDNGQKVEWASKDEEVAGEHGIVELTTRTMRQFYDVHFTGVIERIDFI